MILLKLFITFFKIGAFTFGGGYAMLPMIQQEVLKNNWMEIQDIIDFVAISESTPGPFAVNVSTYVGFRMEGVAGAFCSTLGIVMPSFIIIILVARTYEKFQSNKLVQGAMTGLRPAVVGLIAVAIVTTANSTLVKILEKVEVDDVYPKIYGHHIVNVCEWLGQVIILVASLIALHKKVNPILVIIGSAVIGIIFNYLVL